jgi:hypothetical protein
MGRLKKLLEKVKNNPRQVRFEELDIIGTPLEKVKGFFIFNKPVCRIKSISVCKIPRLDELSVLG